MNQWQTKTGLCLTKAVMKLAAAKPASDINVAELCREAGITRDTFYRYASSPSEVLAAALNADLTTFSGFAKTFKEEILSFDELLAPAARELLEHVKRNHAIYRKALRPHLDSALRDVLISRIEKLLMKHLLLHPSIAPDILGTRPSRGELLILASYTSSGCVGVVEQWIKQKKPADIERMVEILFVGSPAWWLARNKTGA